MTDQANSMAANARWTSRSVGAQWQHSFFYFIIRFCGRVPAYIIMYFVSAWYVLLVPYVRRRCRSYLDKRFPERTGFFQKLVDDYRRIASLGEALIDRAAFGLKGSKSFKIEFPEGGKLLELIDEKNGLILLNSHVGCWQMVMAFMKCMESPVSLVMQREQADLDLHYFEHAGEKADFNIIDPASPLGGVMEMIDTLEKNHVLGLMGDRVFGEDNNTLEAMFLGGPVLFPVSPYRLASMKGTPIVVLFSRKTGFSSYCIEIGRVIRVPTGLGRKNEAYSRYVNEFASVLEENTEKHPWQFFNFHEMWEQH